MFTGSVTTGGSGFIGSLNFGLGLKGTRLLLSSEIGACLLLSSKSEEYCLSSEGLLLSEGGVGLLSSKGERVRE